MDRKKVQSACSTGLRFFGALFDVLLYQVREYVLSRLEAPALVLVLDWF